MCHLTHKKENAMIHPTAQRKKTVMVADDNEGILNVTKIILERGGYIAITTQDGSNVRNLKEPLPDLLLLDIMLSGTNGSELCRALKENKKTKGLPVLMFSANNDIKKISKSCGANGYVAKPFDMDHLLELVELHTTQPLKKKALI